MNGVEFGRIEVLTFDCYGTLIDWERGILDALRPAFLARGIAAGADALLEVFATNEADLEGGPYQPYRDVLAGCIRGIGRRWGFSPTDEEVRAFSESVGEWPAFEDSSTALGRLSERFRLGVITNCDEDLFARSNARLGVTFDWIVTAQRAGSYKPSPNNFEIALAEIDVPRERVLHVAQSLYHDHVPAKRLGLSTAWVDRRHGRHGFGATRESSATPDLTVPDMRSLAELALA